MSTAMLVVEEKTLGNKAMVHLIADVITNVKNTWVISMDAGIVGKTVAGVKIGGFVPTQFSKTDLNICFGFPYTAGTRPRNLLLTNEKNARDKYGKVGFVVVDPATVSGYDELLAIRDKSPKYTPVLPAAPSSRIVDKAHAVNVSKVWDKRKGGLTGQKHAFVLKNTAEIPITQKCRFVVSWCSAEGVPIVGSPRATMATPAIKPGESERVHVPIPSPPADVGNFMLEISVKSETGHPLGISVLVPMRLR